MPCYNCEKEGRIRPLKHARGGEDRGDLVERAHAQRRAGEPAFREIGGNRNPRKAPLERLRREDADRIAAERDHQAVPVEPGGCAEQPCIGRLEIGGRGMHDDHPGHALGAVGVALPFRAPDKVARQMLAGEQADRLRGDRRQADVDEARVAGALRQVNGTGEIARRLDGVAKRREFGVDRAALGRRERQRYRPFGPLGKRRVDAGGR